MKLIRIFPYLWAVVVLMCYTGKGSAIAGTVTLKGSDTMVVLGQKWAEGYMKANPGTVIQVTGGGSGTGISALQNGTTDIAMSSRSISDKEKNASKIKHGVLPVETAVAKDGISVYVHPKNALQEITLEQLAAVYTGEITNWKQLGGPDSVIVLYGRENSSGTYVYFKEHVLEDEDFSPKTQTLPGTAAVVNAVSKEKMSMGYGGAAYASGVKLLKVKKEKSSAGIEATPQSVKAGQYPISRDLYFYTGKAPTGDVKKFIDWCLSPAGQKIVEEVGYFSVK